MSFTRLPPNPSLGLHMALSCNVSSFNWEQFLHLSLPLMTVISFRIWTSYFSKQSSLGSLCPSDVCSWWLSGWVFGNDPLVGLWTSQGSPVRCPGGPPALRVMATTQLRWSLVSPQCDHYFSFIMNNLGGHTLRERMCIPSYSSSYPPTSCGTHWWFWPESIFAVMVAKCGSANPIIPSRWNSTFYCKTQLSLLSIYLASYHCRMNY